MSFVILLKIETSKASFYANHHNISEPNLADIFLSLEIINFAILKKINILIEIYIK